jgi:hypothetical protein
MENIILFWLIPRRKGDDMMQFVNDSIITAINTLNVNIANKDSHSSSVRAIIEEIIIE